MSRHRNLDLDYDVDDVQGNYDQDEHFNSNETIDYPKPSAHSTTIDYLSVKKVNKNKQSKGEKQFISRVEELFGAPAVKSLTEAVICQTLKENNGNVDASMNQITEIMDRKKQLKVIGLTNNIGSGKKVLTISKSELEQMQQPRSKQTQPNASSQCTTTAAATASATVDTLAVVSDPSICTSQKLSQLDITSSNSGSSSSSVDVKAYRNAVSASGQLSRMEAVSDEELDDDDDGLLPLCDDGAAAAEGAPLAPPRWVPECVSEEGRMFWAVGV